MSQKYPNKKIIAVLPAYNAAKTLNRTLADIPKDWIDDIILVDDLSQDDTIKIARAAGLKTFCHQTNLGYGGNQKTCYQEALKMGADIIIMIHPDHQYDPRLVPDLLLPLLRHDADAVFGSRMMRPGAALKGGMPWWKYTANIILSKLANLILGLRLTEYHSGFRAYSKKSLNSVNYLSNSNDFVFDTEIIIQLKLKKLRIQEIPISTHYFPAASSIGLQRSIVYGLSILKNLCKYILYKLKLKDYPQYH
ncbi:TPA: glycosyl transferase family 2 [Patescibacteria group bacterium]|nr:glycosyl transferase family 2 [Patescibacteria group bacterium]HCU48033.1 glycosyl transferase family 2 [Patescibacteria group bacterium]